MNKGLEILIKDRDCALKALEKTLDALRFAERYIRRKADREKFAKLVDEITNAMSGE